MDLLTYTSNPNSELNEARRQLWSSKYMLDMSAKNPGEYASPEFWKKMIDQDSSRLMAVARQLRAKIPTRKVYKIHMRGEASEFGFWERAHTRGQAISQARERYADCFDIVSVEVADV